MSNRHGEYRRKTWSDLRSSTPFIITTVAMGMFTDLFLWGVIIPILPFIVEDRLQIPRKDAESRASWLLSTNSVGAFLFSPIAGIIADKVRSRRTPFLFGVILLILATVLLEVGRDIRVLLLARLFQGISGAVVWTVGLAICLETVGSKRLGFTMGSIWSVISLGSQVAPVVGGMLYRYFAYEGVFGVSVALLFLDLILRVLVVERKTANPPSSNEGAELANDTVHVNETSPLISDIRPVQEELYILDVCTNSFLGAFPIIRCLKHSGLLTALSTTFIQAIILSAFDATLPLIAIKRYQLDSFSTGLLFLALGVPEVLVSPMAGWLVDRRGTKRIATLAWAILGFGVLFIAFQMSISSKQNRGKSSLAIFTTLLTVCGGGIAATGAPTLTEASAIVERYYRNNKDLFGHAEPYALLYGINSLAFNAGFSVGPVLSAYMEPVVGYAGVYLLLAGLSIVTAACSGLFFEQ